MGKYKIIGEHTPNMPWEEKSSNEKGLLWRYSKNPIIPRDPTEHCARVFNSAVIPYGDSFVGIFRADHVSGAMRIHFGRTDDAINWEIDDDVIKWVDEDGNPYQPSYAYDPRLVKIDDTYYMMWCTSFASEPTIGLGKTKDFSFWPEEDVEKYGYQIISLLDE